MSTATLERLPNTVSACHAEIARLRKVIAESGVISEIEVERDELKEKLRASELENEALERRVDELEEEYRPDAIAAIDRFLFEVQRPVGKFTFDVLHGPATDRAIVGLYDAAGRQP